MNASSAHTCEHRPRPYRLRAVLFDFDGTLTRPGAIDFAALKRELGCPPDRLVLEWVEALPAGAQRKAALATLERFELDGAAASAPNDGAEELLRSLRSQGLLVGVLTRNGRAAVDRALAGFSGVRRTDFDVVVTRDDTVAPKPAPDGVLHAAAAMGVPAAETLVVGDYHLDMQAGRAAGAVTAYLTNGAHGPSGPRAAGPAGAAEGPPPPDPDLCDVVVHSLSELEGVVRLGLPLPQGKLPNEYLARHLEAAADDAGGAVLIPAGVGEDITALDMTGIEVVVAHGDPITLGGAGLGRAAVLVNANDIAASGGDPRWLLTTVLLPPGTTPSAALALLADIAATAAAEGITVVGGHTEVTQAVTRSVVSATLLGTVSRAELRDKRAVLPGDAVILTKSLALEGTALLAEELGERLHALGLSAADLAACRELATHISIVPEARIATGFAGVRALHDVTEGGLATALRELATACGHGISVRLERVAVHPLTAQVCGALGADPLGLIASGSLLVCCEQNDCAALLDALGAAGIPAAMIGEIGAPPTASAPLVVASDHGRPAPWPEFAADEAARLLL